jgi:hypothetical protein
MSEKTSILFNRPHSIGSADAKPKGEPKMARSSKLYVKLNIGDDDVKRGFPRAFEGDVIDVSDENIAEQMIRNGWAETYDAETVKQRQEAIADRDATLLMAQVQNRKAMAEAEKRAEERLSAMGHHTAVKSVANPDDSPVSTSNVTEATSQIAGMRSKEKLQSIVDNDPRSTVKEAAKRRIAEL